MKLCVQKPFLHGTIQAPPSKSHTLRALICAALAEGSSYITAPLLSADTMTAVNVLRQLGVTIQEIQSNPPVLEVTPPNGGMITSGLPLGGLMERKSSTPAEIVLDLGNSGSLLYFLGVLLTVSTSSVCLTGDTSLHCRPVEPLITLYRQTGIGYAAREEQNGTVFPPIRFCGPLRSGTFRLIGPFSQPVTGMLLAAPLLSGTTRIFFEQPGERPYIQMTCGWLHTAGIDFICRSEQYFEITGTQRYRTFSKTVPGDWSSALFPLIAAVICNRSLTLHNLDLEDSQGDSQVISILQKMGADVRYNTVAHSLSVFPVASTLHGGYFDCSDIPDAVPILAVAALFCEGQTVLENVGVCRFKECDRLKATAEELAKFGGRITEGKDFLHISGTGGQGLYPAQVQSRKDHRIAMMLAVAACGIAAHLPETTGSANSSTPNIFSYIEDFDCVQVSYPDFVKDMNNAGAAFITIPS